MASVVQSQMVAPENLRRQLAVAVRSIQWSYAIFWSLSASQHGVLEWLDGYYNGDIKTRKTVQAMDPTADKTGLRRSKQLRELYKSLLEGELDSQQARRPSAALSPEDLTDEEWYYLVCMSFVFNLGQGLPGRALANKETIWLCNAEYADSKVFSRSLLAKSASIQTVVCFPYLDGVIELGVTEQVTEDPGLIQHIKTSLLDLSKPVCSKKSSCAPSNGDGDQDSMGAKVNHEIVDTLAFENLYNSAEDTEFDHERTNELHQTMKEELSIESPDQTEDSFMLEGLNSRASQVQSWHFIDDEFSDCVHDSMNSCDCISEDILNEEKALSLPKAENASHLQLKELQEGNHAKLSSLDIGANDDMHYRRTLSILLRSSNQLIESLCFRSGDYESSFVTWKKGAVIDGHRPQREQSMLKKILFAVPLVQGHPTLKFHKEYVGKGSTRKWESHKICKGHILLDEHKENEKFLVLRSMIPSISEDDRTSILGDTIRYLKELEARVEELESCVHMVDYQARPRNNRLDMVEQTSDNYDYEKIDNGKKPWINKRKACDIDQTDPQLNDGVPKNGLPLDVKVSMKEEVLIEIRCPYREYILLDIMDEINHLHMEVHSVQSSTLDGILSVTLKSKFRGAAVAPAAMIKQAIQRVACKS